MKYQAQRGTKDILPSETPVWQFVEETARDVFQNYGFKEIRTPVFEQTDLFTRSIGEGTDIVSKEMYTFIDRGERSLTLRPEGTAGVVRAAIENNLLFKDRTVKLYYMGPMFRYERPQAGRQRQFNQVGIEIFGSNSFYSDVEVMLSTITFFNKLGLKSLEIDLNSVGCDKCRPVYILKLREYLIGNKAKLCDDCKTRTETNTLRVLDCKVEGCQHVILNSPKIREHICEDCKVHLESVKTNLEGNGVSVKLNDRLVRGLDYYTRTIFEVVSPDLGAQNAVCGGGRYDSLVEQLGGKPTPAVGMAVGMERLISILKSQELHKTGKKKKSVYFAAIGTEAVNLSFKQINELRKAGLDVETDYMIGSLSSHLKTADGIGADFTVIIGDEEIKAGKAKIRDMKTKEQKEVAIEDISKSL